MATAGRDVQPPPVPLEGDWPDEAGADASERPPFSEPLLSDEAADSPGGTTGEAPAHPATDPSDNPAAEAPTPEPTAAPESAPESAAEAPESAPEAAAETPEREKVPDVAALSAALAKARGAMPAAPARTGSDAPADGEQDALELSGPRDALVRVHPDMPKVNPNLVFGATLALYQPPRFTAQELLDTVNEILEGTGAAAVFDPDMKGAGDQPRFSLLKRRLKGPPSAILRVNGLKTLVGGGDKPAFTGKSLRDRVNPALWAEGVKRLGDSRGHVMIADAHPNDPNDPDLNYDRAVAVTVTAAAVSLLTDPAGIVWHPAGNATPPDVIPDFVQSLAEGLAPLPLWLRWLLVPPAGKNLNPGAASRGLEALLGMEMEIAPNKKSLEQTVGHLFQLAAIHVRLGKAPPDGSQVGTKDKTWYHVQYADKGTVANTPVYRLTPVAAYTGG